MTKQSRVKNHDLKDHSEDTTQTPSTSKFSKSEANHEKTGAKAPIPLSATILSLICSSKHLNSLTPVKAAALVVLCTVLSLLLFQNYEGAHTVTKKNLATDTAAFLDNISTAGGWRPATEEVLEKYGSDICTIERVSVLDLPPERFESEFRYKKPVLVSFPNGAGGWTEPEKWSRDGLVKAYSKWTIHSGQSLEIVRKGGNARHATSFSDFVDKLLSDTTNGVMHYAFDRRFYWESKLPKTLHLPKYFQVNVTQEESIFFLGSSLTGVVFHKHSDTWNGVVYGRKRWFLYPISKTPPGGVHHGFPLLEWVDDVYPNLPEKDKPLECIQEAGEILYLPEGFYHATLNLGDTVAVAIQKKDAVVDAEVLSYNATKLINFLQEQKDPDPRNSFNVQLLEIYKKWHELLPESSEAMMKIGDMLFEMGDYAESLPWHMKAIKTDPYFILAYIHMGKTFAKLREYEKAEMTFKKAIEMSPNLWDNYKEYGEFLLRQGRHKDALPIFKKGTELMPEMIPFWFYYKLCQVQLGDQEGAEASEKAIVNLRVREELESS